MNRSFFVLCLSGLLLLGGCGGATEEAAAPEQTAKPRIVASNFPLYAFTRAIGGDAVEVDFPVIEGDPAFWAPGGEDVALLQDADLLVINGAGYESWLAFTTLPSGLVLDTTAGLEDRLVLEEDQVVHQHGPGGEHSHGETAFTTWLNPQLALAQARAIRDELSARIPERTADFAANFDRLAAQLEALDGQLADAFKPLGDRPVLFSHPVYQYLERRYGIFGRSLHWEPDVPPGTRDWIDLTNLRREHPAAVMIWEGAPLPETVAQLEAQGVRSLVFDPAGNAPKDADYFELMKANLRAVNEFMSTEGAEAPAN